MLFIVHILPLFTFVISTGPEPLTLQSNENKTYSHITHSNVLLRYSQFQLTVHVATDFTSYCNDCDEKDKNKYSKYTYHRINPFWEICIDRCCELQSIIINLAGHTCIPWVGFEVGC